MKNPFKTTKKAVEETPATQQEVSTAENNTELWERYWKLKETKAEAEKALSEIQELLIHRANENELWEGKTARFATNAIRKVTTEKLVKPKDLSQADFFEVDERFERYSKFELNEKNILSDLKSGDKNTLKVLKNEFGFDIKVSETYQFIKN